MSLVGIELFDIQNWLIGTKIRHLGVICFSMKSFAGSIMTWMTSRWVSSSAEGFLFYNVKFIVHVVVVEGVRATQLSSSFEKQSDTVFLAI